MMKVIPVTSPDLPALAATKDTDPEEVPAPGTPSANALDTARAEVNAAVVMTAMVQPSADAILAIGAVAVKVRNAIKAVTRVPWSSWGFF